MIVFKLYKYKLLEELNSEYFNTLLEILKNDNFLSPLITEIVFTDDIEGEVTKYSNNQFRQSLLTRTREYFGIATTVLFDDKYKIIFDIVNVNADLKHSRQIFFEQLLRVYAEDIVFKYPSVSKVFTHDTPLPEIAKMLFYQWASEVVSDLAAKVLELERENIHKDVKMFVDSFKRNIRKLHYQYQDNLSIEHFWIDSVNLLDHFVRRCLDVKFDNGSFENLQEFTDFVPALISEIELQTNNLLNNTEVDFSNIQQNIQWIFNKCAIDIINGSTLNIEITESPKKLFKGNIVDTESRIVAFIDILGFSAIIDEYDSDNRSNILNELHDTLELSIKISIENMIEPKPMTDLKEYLEYRMFSDCICISIPYIEFENDFHIQFLSLSTVVKVYQLTMMQKGFFVRGGISIGSYYSDKNMIFSGGLVSAYKLEQNVSYPIIAISKTVVERLQHNFEQNTKGLVFENIILFRNDEPEKIFLNPFDLLDNSTKYFDYLQSTMVNQIKEIEADNDDSLSDLATSLWRLTNAFTKPIFDDLKSQMTLENINSAKEHVLKNINIQLEKYSDVLDKSMEDSIAHNEAKKIIFKFEYLRSLTEWSMGKRDSKLFKHYQFK